MLGIGCPDRHALLRITSPKLRRPRRLLPSRERVRSPVHLARCPASPRGSPNEPIAGVQHRPQERVLMPQTGHPARREERAGNRF